MKLISAKTGLQYQPDQPNHQTYLPPLKVLQHTLASKAKGTGLYYEQVLPTTSLGGNMRHPQSRTTDEAITHASTEDTTQARVMTYRGLLISLHQKVDKNHDWVKRPFSELLSYMAHTHSSVKK